MLTECTKIPPKAFIMLPFNQHKEAWKSKRVNDHLSVNDNSLVIYDNWMKLM